MFEKFRKSDILAEETRKKNVRQSTYGVRYRT